MNVWDLLGIAPTHDIRAIKRAYSIKLKTTRPDDDAQAYQLLREAYDWAQNFAKFQLEHGVVEIEGSASPGETSEAGHVEPEVDAGTSAADMIALVPTVESLVQECAGLWAEHGSAGLVQDWPRQQALLEDLPIAEHNHASRAFAQFVTEEADLPVEVLVALTRHFEWGLDFRVDHMLGQPLSQALYLRLNEAEVFAAFRPERFTQHAWALALAKLIDGKRGFLARLLAAGLDCPTRHRVLQARLGTLHALGASRVAAKATLDIVAKGGQLQGVLFALLVVGVLVFLHEPGIYPKWVWDAIVLGLAARILFFPYRDIPRYQAFIDEIRIGQNLDWTALIPVVVAPLVFVDQHFSWLAGYSNSPTFLYCMISVYFGIWLFAQTEEHAWRTLVLPTFFLLLYGLRPFFSGFESPLLISLAFAWTMGAHVVLRRYPDKVEWVYLMLVTMGVVHSRRLSALAFCCMLFVWTLTTIAMLPVLLFRMAVKYRVLYACVAIYAGVLLGNVQSAEGRTQGLLAWVLAAVICIQILQFWSQRLSNFGLKKLLG